MSLMPSSFKLNIFLSIGKTFPKLTTCNFSQKNDKKHPLKLFLQKLFRVTNTKLIFSSTNHDFASFSFCTFFVLNASVLKGVGFRIFWHFGHRLRLTIKEFQLRNKSKRKVLLIGFNIVFKYICCKRQIKYVFTMIRFDFQNK